MSDLSSASYGNDKCCDNGISPIFMILLLSMLCGGDNGLFGCGCGSGSGSNSCGLGGMDGILPILLILCLCGGSLF